MQLDYLRNLLPEHVQNIVNTFVNTSDATSVVLDDELEQRLQTCQESISKAVTQLVQDCEIQKNVYDLNKRLLGLLGLFKDDKQLLELFSEFPEKFGENEALKSLFRSNFYKLTSFLKTELNMIQDQMKSKEEVLKKQTQWVKNLGFPESVLSFHSDFVDFLMDSELAFKISMFQNTTKKGKEIHVIACDEDGMPMMRCNGTMQRWDTIKKMCVYDPIQGKVVSCENKEKGWNYISPKGLVEKDPFDYERLYAIEKIESVDYKEIREQAEKYWETNEEIDPGIEKDCIFQIVTTKKSLFPRWLPEFLKENLDKNSPSHTYLRFIKPNGKVYSFGFEMKSSEQKQVLEFLPFTFLRSGLTKFSTSDYDESRKFELRYVTSIPVTKERLKASLEYVVAKNKEGLRFCFKDDNCTRGAVDIAKINGVQIDPTMTIRDFFWRILPDFEKIPVIGPVFIEIAQKIQLVANALLQAMPSVQCEVVNSTHKTLSETVQILAKSIENIFYNALIYLMGGAEMTTALQEMKKKAEETLTVAPQAMTLFNDGLNFLKDPVGGVFHSIKVTEWQLQQPSTVTIAYEGKPRLYLHSRPQEIKA